MSTNTPEGKVKAAVRKLLDKFKCYYFFVPQNGYGRSGVPDIVGCINGHFFAIECKAGKNITTALQDRELAAIQEALGTVFIIRENNIFELERWLDSA